MLIAKSDSIEPAIDTPAHHLEKIQSSRAAYYQQRNCSASTRKIAIEKPGKSDHK